MPVWAKASVRAAKKSRKPPICKRVFSASEMALERAVSGGSGRTGEREARGESMDGAR